MSSSSAPLKESFTLALLDLPQDANLTIYDGRDQVCLTSTGMNSVNTTLPKGLYTVRGELAGVIQETPVRLDRDVTLSNSEQTQLVPQQYTAAPLKGTALSHEYYRYPSQEWSVKTTRAPFGTETTNSAFFLFIRPRDSNLARPALEEATKLRLLDARGDLVTSFEAWEVQTKDSDGWLALSVEAPAGYYTLEYDGSQPRALALYLFPNWQTQVFLLNHGRLLMEGARIFLANRGLGFNPNRDDITQATDLGLDYLQNNLKRLPNEVLQELLKLKFENPMLGFVAAHVLLMQETLNQELLRIVLDNLDILVGKCADLAAIKLLFALRSGQQIETTPFEHPPMFRAGLEAVIRASFDRQELLPEEGQVERMTPDQLTDSPWSSWSVDGSVTIVLGDSVKKDRPSHWLGFGLPPSRSRRKIRRGLPPLDWIQAAFLDTVAGQIRTKQIAEDLGSSLPEDRPDQISEHLLAIEPATISFGKVEIDLREFALTLGLPRRTVMEAVEGLVALPVSPDELMTLRAQIETENSWPANARINASKDIRSAGDIRYEVSEGETES